MLYKTRNPHGGDVYSKKIRLDFSSNSNPFGTPESVKEAIKAAAENARNYPDPYCRELVGELASHEGVPEDSILCGNGAAELIYSVCAAVNGSVAVETAPTFSEYSEALGANGFEVRRYALDSNKDFEVDRGILDFIGINGPDIVFVCNPGNPTGMAIDADLLADMALLCKKNGSLLVVDECFLDLSDGLKSMVGLTSDNRNVLVLKDFSKSYALAGVRLGYCISSNHELLGAMSKTVQLWNVSSLAQAAGTASLRERDYLERTRKFIAGEREWMKAQLEKIGFRVCRSDASYLLMHGAPGLAEALEGEGIAIRDCSNYHGLSAGWYRTAVRLHDENVELISALRGAAGHIGGGRING